MEVNLTSQMTNFIPQEMQYHIGFLVWPNYGHNSQNYAIDLQAWMYNIRLEAFPSICWGRFMYMWRIWFHGGEVDESATLFVLLVIVGEPKGFPPIEMAAIHIIPFFRTYLGRTEWDSASMCRNWRVNIDNLIVASFPTPTIYRRSWDDPRKKTLTRTETAGAVHQSLQLGDWKEISKVVKNCVLACFPTLSISTSRTESWRDSVLDFLGRCRSSAMGCASELNKATISSLNIYTRSIFHAVNSCPSSI